MKKYKKGEIMTALMVISLVVIGVSTVISTALLQRNKQTITSKALEATSCPNPDDNSKWYCAGECADQSIRDLFNGTYPPDGSDEWRNEKAGNCGIGASVCQSTTSCGIPSPTPNCPAGKLNVNGGCDPACCANDDQCKDNSPQPQRCLNPNGYCQSGTSCAVVNTQDQAQFIRKCSGAACAWVTCSQSEKDAGECSTDTNNPNPKSLKCSSHTECGATPTITPYKSPTPGPSPTKGPSVTPGGSTLTPTPTPTIPASGDRLGYGINCPANTPAEIYVYSLTNEWPELFIDASIGKREGPMAQNDIQPKKVDPRSKGSNSVDYHIEARFSDGKIEKHDLLYRYPNNCSPSYSSTPPSATPTPQKSPTPSLTPTPTPTGSPPSAGCYEGMCPAPNEAVKVFSDCQSGNCNVTHYFDTDQCKSQIDVKTYCDQQIRTSQAKFTLYVLHPIQDIRVNTNPSFKVYKLTTSAQLIEEIATKDINLNDIKVGINQATTDTLEFKHKNDGFLYTGAFCYLSTDPNYADKPKCSVITLPQTYPGGKDPIFNFYIIVNP